MSGVTSIGRCWRPQLGFLLQLMEWLLLSLLLLMFLGPLCLLKSHWLLFLLKLLLLLFLLLVLLLVLLLLL